MSLEAYQRGPVWWAKGRVEYNGRAITAYIRESTGASSQDGAQDWIADREEAERRRYLLGEEQRPLTFDDALLLYDGAADVADQLSLISAEIGRKLVRDITPQEIRDLGPKLYPGACSDTWRRWVVTPARAVINNGHDKRGPLCPPIKIKGYPEKERIAQDKKRKKASRIERRPGDWEWLLKFRQHAPARLGALALFMFVTGRRIGQSVAMHPERDLDLQNARVRVPGAKGHADSWITIPMELVIELASIKPKTPRGWNRDDKRNQRVFGYADRCAPLKAWRSTCIRAGIDYRSPHAAGRHGFGQEHVVRQGTDAKATAKFGAWSDTAMLAKTYTHAEDVDAKIHAAFRTGLEQAEASTGLKLLKVG